MRSNVNIASDQIITTAQFAWLSELVALHSPRDIAHHILQLVHANLSPATAHIVWAFDNSSDGYQIEPAAALMQDQLTLTRATESEEKPRSSDNGKTIALALAQCNAVILITITDAHKSETTLRQLSEITSLLHIAAQHFHRALASIDLQVAIADLERSERLQRALFAISDLAGSDQDMSEVLRGIHMIVGTLMYAENFFIVFYNVERDSMRFVYYADIEDDAPDPALEIPMHVRNQSFTWHLLKGKKPLMGNPAQLRTQVVGELKIVGTTGKNMLGVPLLRNGQALGGIVVQTYRDGVIFTPEDRSVLEFVGSNILIALERRQSREDLEQRVQLRTIELADANQVLQQEIIERQRAEQLHVTLFHIAQLATADISQSELYPRVHAEVSTLINAQNFFIALLSDDDQMLHFPYAIDNSGETFVARKIGRGLSEYVLKHGKTILRAEDLRALAATGEIDLQTVGIPTACWMGVPLLADDKTIGLVVVQSYSESVLYTLADQELLSFAASQIANTLHRRLAAENLHAAYTQLEQRVHDRTQELRDEISERERIQEQLKHEVLHDTLTDLPNRGYLLDRLTRVLAQLKREPKHVGALLYLDIDRFKIINDSLGHLAGDQVLKEVARRLLECVREPDVVARLSGDEFAILIGDVSQPTTAIKVAQRVLSLLREPLLLMGKEVNSSVSIGIAIIDERYHLADEVLKDADLALYRAKKTGRNRFELFDETMQKNAVNVLAIEAELRIALQQNQFEPYFQPIVRLSTGSIVGYEALIRWNHPTRGVIGPGDFLSIAEENGSIEAIDWHMFELSCKLMTTLADNQAYLTINCSPLHFRRADFDTRLLDMLQHAGLSTHRLVTEVTEGSLLEDTERVCATLERLRAVGVGAAIDDFGTGYSSLSYLHKLPLRTLKIDRSFVSALTQGTSSSGYMVVAAILAMASALDLSVVAEGIETEEQQRILTAMGCGFGQGYFLGRPAPIGHWIKRSES